ncbi:MAG: GNAT family N-acetyltransferase [Geothrix sp.]|uniref:GNAT family N-acetyltransferase n=1 Tax=Geothrix sp. TaxID=1962974 RepID=UPI003BB1B6B3
MTTSVGTFAGLQILDRAADLPAEWDTLSGDNFYLRSTFLQFIETVDSCEQRYCIFRDARGVIDTILMTYVRHDFNLFMFTPIRAALRVTFIYVPLSVTRPGYAGHEQMLPEVAAYLRAIKGYKVFLNTRRGFRLEGFAQTTTFPRCMLRLRWNRFEDYLESMRSGYRRRYRIALRKSQPLTYRMLADNREFNDELYRLYEQVYDNSPYRIEKLSKSFFQGPHCKIFVYELAARPVGFVQLIENGSELIFEFVGFDHALNGQYDIYISLLLRIVEHGIANGFKIINFGQTADEAKLKLGSRYRPLFALLHHSNVVTNFLTRLFINAIGYKPLDQDKFHIFKDQTNRPAAEEQAHG